MKEHYSLGAEDTTTILDEIHSCLLKGLSHAEEKVSLAEHIHQSVKGHLVKLEDDLKHFEEEVRLAKLAEANKTIVHQAPENDQHITIVAESASSKKKDKRSKSKDDVAGDFAPKKRSRNALDSAPTGRIEPHNEGEEGGKKAPEPTYCYCGQPSYGEMVGCDANSDCEIEWFHYGCVGLEAPPQDQWFCPDCSARMAKNPLAVPKDSQSSSKKPRPSFVK